MLYDPYSSEIHAPLGNYSSTPCGCVSKRKTLQNHAEKRLKTFVSLSGGGGRWLYIFEKEGIFNIFFGIGTTNSGHPTLLGEFLGHSQTKPQLQEDHLSLFSCRWGVPHEDDEPNILWINQKFRHVSAFLFNYFGNGNMKHKSYRLLTWAHVCALKNM